MHNINKVWFDYFKDICSNRWLPVITRHEHFINQQSSGMTTITVVSHPHTETILSIIVTQLQNGSKPQCNNQRDFFLFCINNIRTSESVHLTWPYGHKVSSYWRKTQCAWSSLLWLVGCGNHMWHHRIQCDRCVLMWTEAIFSCFEGLHRDILMLLSLSASLRG